MFQNSLEDNIEIIKQNLWKAMKYELLNLIKLFLKKIGSLKKHKECDGTYINM